MAPLLMPEHIEANLCSVCCECCRFGFGFGFGVGGMMGWMVFIVFIFCVFLWNFFVSECVFLCRGFDGSVEAVIFGNSIAVCEFGS